MSARVFALAVAFACVPHPALAHVPIEGVGGFYGGLLHPLLTPAHLMALAALGLLIGQQERRPRRMLFGIFAASLIAGITAVVLAFAATSAGEFVLGTAAVGGLLIASAWPAPVINGVVAAVGGGALSFDSVPEEISMAASVLALAGTAIGAMIILGFVAEVTRPLKRDWQRIGMRIAGSWIAASAILVLALRLAR